MKKPSIYLIPNLLGESNPDEVIPVHISQVVSELKYFIVENIRTARRFLKKINSAINIDTLIFFELNKHTDINTIEEYLNPIREGSSIGIISEAGVPCIADPGSVIVQIAHQRGIHIKPLVGPSSILLALMASGLNGQNFAFNGYLPIKKPERITKIRFYEKRSKTEDQTQIFIETPYRNHALLEDLIAACHPDTLLCIAADITLASEFIHTTKMSDWKRKKTDLHKRPCIFMIHCY